MTRLCCSQLQRTRAFCTELDRLGLLKAMHATLTQSNGKRQNLTGFKAVDLAKLGQLGDDKLLRMAKTNALELIYLHLHSLNNFGRLINGIGVKPPARKANGGNSLPSRGSDTGPTIH